MKKTVLYIFLFLSVLLVNAQDYLINFSGTGSSTSIETVTVENLTQGKSITLSGSNTLHLLSTATANTPLLEYMDYPLIVYPNPSSGDITIQFEVKKSGMVNIVLFDIAGREINRIQQKVQNGFQSFKVEGLSNGIYTVHVLLEDQKFTKKVICNGKSTSNPKITYNGLSEVEQSITTLKSANSEQSWQYNTGDRLKFQGTSGKYSTIVMDIPTLSKTLSFDFVECTDADGNNYPVVKIGNQLWMAENLKTTKYNDGIPIKNEKDNTNWMNLSTAAYCWYNNDISNKATYGALYNWFAVDSNKLAPKGWHVPTNVEWSDFITLLGGEEEAGGKLKEISTKHWADPNMGATDEVGFTALPSGIRLVDKQNSFLGDFSIMSTFCYWWTSYMDNSNTRVNVKELGYNNPNINANATREKQTGCSVRCIKDIPKIPTPKFVSKSANYKGINSTTSALKKSYYYPGFNMNFNANNPDLDKIKDIPYTDNAGLNFNPTIGSGVFLDFDSNNQLDYFGFMPVENWSDPCKVKLRIIKNVFTEEREFFIYDTNYNTGMNTVQLNDFNGDGINEVIVGSSNYHFCGVNNTHGEIMPIEIYYINPDGSFRISSITPPTQLHDFTSGDIDNDGDVDLVYFSFRQEIDNPNQLDYWPFIYLNDGLGNFKEVDSYSFFRNLDKASNAYKVNDNSIISGRFNVLFTDLFDLNNDGILDLIIGNNYLNDIMLRSDWNNDNKPDFYPLSAIVMWGEGNGKFNFDNISRLENKWMINKNYDDLLKQEDVNQGLFLLSSSFFDYDNDGNYDIFLSGSPFYKGEFIHVLKNNGDKTFSDVTEEIVDNFYSYHGVQGGTNSLGEGNPQFYDLIFYDYDDDGLYDIIPSASGWAYGLHFNPNKPEFYYKNLGGKFTRKHKW